MGTRAGKHGAVQTGTCSVRRAPKGPRGRPRKSPPKKPMTARGRKISATKARIRAQSVSTGGLSQINLAGGADHTGCVLNQGAKRSTCRLGSPHDAARCTYRADQRRKCVLRKSAHAGKALRSAKKELKRMGQPKRKSPVTKSSLVRGKRSLAKEDMSLTPL